MTRAQALRAEVSEIAHESFDGALVVKTLGREAEETDAVRRPRRTSCATSTSAPAGSAARSTRCWRRCPASACSSCSPSACCRVRSRRDRRRRRGHRRLPAHDRGLPDPLDRLGARRVPAQRGRLRPGAAGARRDRRDDVRRPRRSPPAARGARLDVDDLGLPLRRRASRCSTTSTFTVEPGRTVAVVGATACGKSTLTSLLTRLVDPDDGRGAARRHRPARPRPRRSSPSTAALVPQQAFLFDDTVRGNVTLGADVPDEEVWAALRTAQADGFVAALPRRPRHPARGARHHPVRRPAAAALAGPGAGPPPAAAGPGRRHLRGRPRGRGPDPGRAARPATGDSTRGGGRLPQGHDRAGRRGGLPRATAGSSTAAPTPSCWPATPATPDLVNAYEQEAPTARWHVR